VSPDYKRAPRCSIEYPKESRGVQRAAKPVLAGGTAVAAVAGGVAVRKMLQPGRHTIDLRGVGWPKLHVASPKVPDMSSIAEGVSKAGEQVGRTGQQLSRIAGGVVLAHARGRSRGSWPIA
jgi:hypothetical protein